MAIYRDFASRCEELFQHPQEGARCYRESIGKSRDSIEIVEDGVFGDPSHTAGDRNDVARR